MIAIITAILESLRLFLLLKNKTFYYDIRVKSINRQNELINEIEKLRNLGTPDDTARADILRAELLKERKELEYISASIITPESKSANPNS